MIKESEFNRDTGIFTLTLEDARNRHSTKDKPISPPDMNFYAEKLGKMGFEIVNVYEDYMEIKSDPVHVWEALSGQLAYL